MTELVAVMSVTLVLLSITSKVFFDGMAACREAIDSVDSRQWALLTMKRWRLTVGDSRPDEWRLADGVFRAGPREVRREADRLVFVDGATTNALFVPPGTACAFSIERHDGMADGAVMTLTLATRRFRSVRETPLRLVACGAGRDTR